MIPVSGVSSLMISSLVDHLWQSTVITLLVALLAVSLRDNQARIRYGLWMAASVKFLIPFSLLVMAGGYLRVVGPAPIAKPAVSAVMERMAQPFSMQPGLFLGQSAHEDAAVAPPDFALQVRAQLPLILFVVWAGGFLGVSFAWWRKWRTVRQAVGGATPVSALAAIPVLTSRSLLEPGVFGIVRPVLVLPEGIQERLTAAQLRAILRHERCHVERRDNLTSAMHMLTQALFWFHPVVWWIGTRLVEERERACDEAVLDSGNNAEAYAEGILTVCKNYFESPLACVAGVTGADLKKRIVRIVSEQVAKKMGFGRKLLLGAAGFAAVASPVVFGLVHVTPVHAQAAAAGSQEQGLAGIWQGTLQAGRDLRTVLKVEKAGDGAYKAMLYSIDQGPGGIPLTSITLQGSTVKYSVVMIDGSYEGKLSADGNAINGTWTQGAKPLPLNLKRVNADAAWPIPEAPPKLAPMAADAKPVFEVATIKPAKPDVQGKGFRVQGRHFSTINTSLSDLLTFAYGLHARQITAVPVWLQSDKFDLAAQPDGEGQPNDAQWKAMLQKLLAERFKLAFHREQKELSVYALAVGKNGPKMTKDERDPNGLPGLFFRGLGVLSVVNANMEDFGNLLQSAVLDRPVVDQTELKGRYDFLLKWTPDETQFASMGVKVPPPSDKADAPPDLFTALQDQLGLKLQATKAAVAVLVIDHVEKPSEN